MKETKVYQFYGRYRKNMLLYVGIALSSGIALFMLINMLLKVFSNGAVSLTVVFLVVLYIFPLCVLLCFRIAKYVLQRWEASVWRVEI